MCRVVLPILVAWCSGVLGFRDLTQAREEAKYAAFLFGMRCTLLSFWGAARRPHHAPQSVTVPGRGYVHALKEKCFRLRGTEINRMFSCGGYTVGHVFGDRRQAHLFLLLQPNNEQMTTLGGRGGERSVTIISQHLFGKKKTQSRCRFVLRRCVTVVGCVPACLID